MKNIDFVATESGVDIRGGVTLNGSALMTLDNLFPTGMSFVFPSEFDPIIQLGGGWTSIAKEVNLPIGDTIHVNPYPTEHRITGYGTKLKKTEGTTLRGIVNLGIDTSGVLYADGSNSMTGSDYINPAFSNLYAELSTASNTQLVSIWRRDT